MYVTHVFEECVIKPETVNRVASIKPTKLMSKK